MTDDRIHAPAAARNRDPICDVLASVLPMQGLVLEVASGSGEHVIHLASRFPALTFQPSDLSEPARRSIAAWIAQSQLQNIKAPIALDASATAWPLQQADAILCINMIHISPWSATLGLINHAAALLPVGAPLYLYGPYMREGQHTAPSNAAFDQDLRSRNPDWGVRDMADVAALANAAGFSAPAVIEMPANNFSLVFRRMQSVATLA